MPPLRHLLTLLFLLPTTPALAHIGSKDVFEQVQAGPYPLFVTIRMPIILPGIATVEVRAPRPPTTNAPPSPTPTPSSPAPPPTTTSTPEPFGS